MTNKTDSNCTEHGEPLADRCDLGHAFWRSSIQDERGCPHCLRIGLTKARAGNELKLNEVFEVVNKTSTVLFANPDLANRFVSSFPASIAGGLHVVRRPIVHDVGDTPTTSVAFQYRNAEVAKQMFNVYKAFGVTPPREVSVEESYNVLNGVTVLLEELSKPFAKQSEFSEAEETLLRRSSEIQGLCDQILEDQGQPFRPDGVTESVSDNEEPTVEEPETPWLSGQEFKASGEVRTLEVHVVGVTQSGKSAISLLLANLLSRAGVEVDLDPDTKEDLRCEANSMAYPLSEEKLIAYLKNQTASEGKVRICQFHKLQPAVGLVNKEEPEITG